jgi:hypothetical protein
MVPLGCSSRPEKRSELNGIQFSYHTSLMSRHYTCASAASAWGSQKVISIARYSSMAADSSARAWFSRSVWWYSRPSP